MENTVGKGEIARYEQFLLFPPCFQKICTADQGLFGKGLRGPRSIPSWQIYEMTLSKMMYISIILFQLKDH